MKTSHFIQLNRCKLYTTTQILEGKLKVTLALTG